MNTKEKKAQIQNPVTTDRKIYHLINRFAQTKNKAERQQIANEIQDNLEKIVQPISLHNRSAETSSLSKRVSAELAAAMDRYYEASLKNDTLSLLFLIDPLRALSDAGIKLSPSAEKQVRRIPKRIHFHSNALYDDLRQGIGAIDGIDTVRLVRR